MTKPYQWYLKEENYYNTELYYATWPSNGAFTKSNNGFLHGMVFFCKGDLNISKILGIAEELWMI